MLRVERASELPFDTEEIDQAWRLARDTGRLPVFSARMSELNRGKVYDAFPLSEIRNRDVDVATGHFLHTDITPGHYFERTAGESMVPLLSLA